MADVAVEKSGEGRTVLASILLFWTLHYSILAARLALLWPEMLADASLRRIPTTIVAALSCWLVYLALRRWNARPFNQRVLLAALLTIPASMLYGAVNDWLFYYPQQFGFEPVQGSDGKPYSFTMFVIDGITWLGSFFSWAAILLAISYNNEVRDRERRLAQVQSLAQDAQLKALRYQINPHFLFNTLNSISSLIWEKELGRAEAMLISLSTFLRSSLETDPLEDVTLQQEIALQKAYLEIEQIRFQRRLKVDIDIPADLGEARVPSLILQPLVENAIKYGVSPSKKTTHLRIVARREAAELVLEVEDDGGASAAEKDKVKPGTGVGLQNVRQRLRTRFGERSSFQAAHRTPAGFQVRIAMPLRMAS